MSEKVTIIRCEQEARVLYSNAAAMQVIADLLDAGATMVITACQADDFTRLIEGGERKADKPAKPVALKKIKNIIRYKKSKKNNTSAVLRALDVVTETSAMTLAEVAKRSGVSAAVGEVLTRLSKTGRIKRTKDRPFKYWGCKQEDKDGHIYCGARGKNIDRDVCLPNDKLPACKDCKQNK